MANRDAGTIALALGMSEEALKQARQRADTHGEPLIRMLAESLDDNALAEGLADAVGSVVVELEQGELDPQAVRIAPPELAWRHLFLPLAQTSVGWTIAFADPLDEEAATAVQQLVGRPIKALVAPVNELVGALDRLHGPPPPALANEATQRLENCYVPGAIAPVTKPMHRIEDEATLEQRHRALLLALIDAGVLTHEAYVAALRRLLRKDSQ